MALEVFEILPELAGACRVNCQAGSASQPMQAEVLRVLKLIIWGYPFGCLIFYIILSHLDGGSNENPKYFQIGSP